VEGCIRLGKAKDARQGDVQVHRTADNTLIERRISQVLSLIQERFPIFEEALRGDIAIADIALKGDQISAVNLVDGAAST